MKPVHPAPTNPWDGRQYVWDFNNDCYMRVKALPEGCLSWDYEDPGCTQEQGSAASLMLKYGLALGHGDSRTEDELACPGKADVWRDLGGKVIGIFHHESGVVANIPEWRNVDWTEVANAIP